MNSVTLWSLCSLGNWFQLLYVYFMWTLKLVSAYWWLFCCCCCCHHFHHYDKDGDGDTNYSVL